MTPYVSSGRTRFNFVVMMLVYGGAAAFVVTMLSIQSSTFRSPTEQWAVAVPLALFFGGFGVYGLWNLLEALAIYTLDADWIVKRRWNGATQRLAWSDLTGSETRRGGGVTLIGSGGERMEIPLNFRYRNTAQENLGTALQPHLEALQEKQAAQPTPQREFRFGKSVATTAGLFMALVALVIGICIPLAPYSSPPPPAFQIGMLIFGVGSAFFFLWIALQQSTRVLTLTDTHLIDRNLFRRREVAFAEVQSVFSKVMPTNSGSIEFTTVQGAHGKIVINSQLPNYEALVKALHARVDVRETPQTKAEKTEQAIAQDARSQRRQTVVGMFIIGCVFALALAGLALNGIHDAQGSLDRNAQMDARGQQVMGLVTGRERHGSKSTTYYLDYMFRAQGQPYTSMSPITYSDYQDVRIGAPVQVTYMPENPHVCRAAPSISREQAHSRINAGYVMIAIGCGLPFLLVFLALSNKARYLPAP